LQSSLSRFPPAFQRLNHNLILCLENFSELSGNRNQNPLFHQIPVFILPERSFDLKQEQCADSGKQKYSFKLAKQLFAIHASFAF